MKHIIIIIIALLIGAFSFAQETQQKDLKIGVVLSGGGAKGLAHIGVLKVIEEAGIRVDYIGGTSMGAIIGALYASGYNARQLDSIFKRVDFQTLIQDEVPRGAKTFYEKADSEKYAITLPFDDFKLSLPSGISKGQNIYNLLSRLLIHVKDVDDFSKLTIPFLCVATNIETGKEVILNKGYLPKALAASGALPSLFSPVIINDTIYVDGGVVNNYPVDEVRAMGADIVIGVDVQDELRGREDLKSAVDVMVQISNYRTINDMVEKRKKTDIYIHPEIKDFSMVSFAEESKLVNAGEEAAAKLLPNLKKAAAQQIQMSKRAVILNTRESIYIYDVGIHGNENYTRSYVLGKLRLKIPSEVSYKKFNEGVNNLSATGNYDGIDYKFIEDPDNAEEYSVQFQLQESSSKTLLRLAVHYDDLYRTAALINITRKRLFTNNDVASLDLVVGDNLRCNLDYYVDKGFYWSVGLSSAYNTFNQDVATNFILGEEEAVIQQQQVNQLDLEYSDFTNQIFAQTVFRRSFLLRLGAEHKWLRLLSKTIGVDENNLPQTVFENTSYFSSYGVLKYDTFNNKYFPTEGLYFEGDFHWYLFAKGRSDTFDPFSIAKTKIAYALSLSPSFSMLVSASGGFRLGDRGTNSLDFFVGGYGYKPLNNIIPFYGYEALSLRGDTYLSSQITLDCEIFKNNHINISGNIANVGDKLFERVEWLERIDYSGFALGYGLETFFGPIELKYSYSPERRTDEWYVNVGFRF
ncbi:MAG: patatin-like phospholipase family protein [Flavobacteriaceae bacterium]|nr:patatin-like phospholipase family protein [Flavobacteriaceae bacterium]